MKKKKTKCWSLFYILPPPCFHHWSKLEDIFIVFTIEAIVRCWCYWRRIFEFLLHFLADKLSLNNLLFYLWFILEFFWINRNMPSGCSSPEKVSDLFWLSHFGILCYVSRDLAAATIHSQPHPWELEDIHTTTHSPNGELQHCTSHQPEFQTPNHKPNLT